LSAECGESDGNAGIVRLLRHQREEDSAPAPKKRGESLKVEDMSDYEVRCSNEASSEPYICMVGILCMKRTLSICRHAARSQYFAFGMSALTKQLLISRTTLLLYFVSITGAVVEGALGVESLKATKGITR